MLLSKKLEKNVELEIKKLDQLKKMLVENDESYSLNSIEYVEKINESVDYYHEFIKKGTN